MAGMTEDSRFEKQQDTSQAQDPEDSQGGHCSNEAREMFPRELHGWKWALAYVSILSTSFLFALDNTITAAIQPSILSSLGHVELLPWIGVGFTLGTMTILPWGKIYGIFNVKFIYIFNIILFEVGSAICGSAQNIVVLIVARVMLGIGGAGMYSGTMTYVSLTTTPKERPIYMSGNAVVWGIGSVLGPIIGGLFATSSATWRWSFYINLVIGAVFAPGYISLCPDIDPQPTKSFFEKLRMIDWIMTAVFLAGATCFTMAISFGGTVYNWKSATQISLWTVSGILLAVCIGLAKFHHGVSKENRLYPAQFFRQPILMNLQMQIFLSSGIMMVWGTTYYIPLFFQFIRGYGPLEAGICLLPFIAFLVLFSLLCGGFMGKISYIIPWYLGGSMLCTIGSGLMCTIDSNTSSGNIYGYSILVGAGVGSYVVAGFAIMQSIVSGGDISNAIGSLTISQDLGMVVFLSISGALYQNLSILNITGVLPGASSSEIADLIAGTSTEAYRGLSEMEKTLVVPEISDAMRSIWIFFAVSAGVSSVLSVGFGRTRLGGIGKEAEK